MASFAVTFGSFGDIVVVIDLVSKLCTALSDVNGAPAEVKSLQDDLRRYNDLLPLLRTSLLANEAGFVQQTREAIEAELKGCQNTLNALECSINGVSSRMQNRAGPAVMGAYFAAARWRLLGGSKKVKALHTQLEKHFSFLEKYLHIGTSNGQREIHRVANETKVSLAVLVSSIGQPCSQVVSFLELRDRDGKTSFQAFAVIPFRFLATYLEPLFNLLRQQTENQFWILHTGPFFDEIKDHRPGYAYDLCLRGVTSLLQLADFTPNNGEPHRLIGVRPELSSDPSSRLISDVLKGCFRDNVNLGLYDEDLRKACYIQSTLETYNHIVDTVLPSLKSDYADWDLKACWLFDSLMNFPDPEFLKTSPVLRTVETTLAQPHVDEMRHPDAQRAYDQLFGLLNNAPRIPEGIISHEELRGRTRIPALVIDGCKIIISDTVTALLTETEAFVSGHHQGISEC